MFLSKCLILLFALSFIDAEFSYYRPSSQSCAYPLIMHGRARIRQRGNFAKFSCAYRHTLVGNKYATCKNGLWDVPLPVCVKSGCTELEEVKNSVNMTSHNNSWVMFFCLPGYQLSGSPVVYCDGRRWNSTVPECIAPSKAKKISTECDFEKPDICGWKLDELHDFDWRRWNSKTPSYFVQTGPMNDHTYGKNGTGYYMYIESTDRIENETARLISPVYDADLARNACFIFYYHMFGRSMGGLRVYQKPDKVPMTELLSDAERKNYTLFELWGDQGNEWYTSVSMLSDFSDDFQIIMEGIRGQSFMSDIAIDDVSIQHGENCTSALEAASTPSSVLLDTCAGRCDLYNDMPSGRGCSCSLVCFVNQDCCPDFLDLCEFPASNVTATVEMESTTTESPAAPPHTDKLVASPIESIPTTTSTSTTTSTPSTTISTTTSSSTTTSTTTTTTTKRPTTRTYRPTTTTTTAKSPTTTKTTPRTTTSTTTTTLKPTTKVVKPTLKTNGTTLTFEVSSTTIFFVRTTESEDDITHSIGKRLEEKAVEAKKGMSGVVVATIILLVGAVCFGALWGLLMVTRTTRGFMAVGRLRAHATHDPEVRYLKSDDDDE